MSDLASDLLPVQCDVGTNHNTDNRIETQPASSLSSSLKSFLALAAVAMSSCLQWHYEMSHASREIKHIIKYLLSGARNLIALSETKRNLSSCWVVCDFPQIITSADRLRHDLLFWVRNQNTSHRAGDWNVRRNVVNVKTSFNREVSLRWKNNRYVLSAESGMHKRNEVRRGVRRHFS